MNDHKEPSKEEIILLSLDTPYIDRDYRYNDGIISGFKLGVNWHKKLDSAKTKDLEEENERLKKENKRLWLWYEDQCDISYFENKENLNKLQQSNAKLIEALEKVRDSPFVSECFNIVEKALKENKK